MSEFIDKMSDWAESNPVVSNAANFLKDPIGSTGKTIKNTVQDLQTVFTQKDPRQASFSIVDENGDIQEYDLSSGGRVYKKPDGTYTNQRGYAYLSTGNDGKLILNVSKSVADSDWFKERFTENSTFKKVLSMFNANPSAETTITTTDEDGNTKNVTLAEAVKQYNDALGQYASNYEGISLLRDYYNNNTGLNLTDDQIRISENSLSKDSDKQDETKVIYIPDSWQSIYNFNKLASWDPETKTVSAKDFFSVYNLDKDGGISEEQWQDLEAATEADLERAFSGIVSKNLNTEDPEAVKYAGDKLAKAIAAGKTLNNSNPDVSGLHAAVIFASSAGEEFVSKLSKTYGNITEFIIGQTEWLTDSPIAPVSVGGEAIQGALFLTDTPRNAMLAALGAIGDDIASGALSEGNASNYIEEVKNALGDSWNVAHGDKDFTSEYKFLPGGNTLDEFTSTLDADIDYMEKISGAAAGGKFVGNILEMAVEVYITEKTGGLVGGAIESSAMGIGRGLGLVFNGSKIKDQANLLTKLFLAASKTTAWTGNMLTQGFMDTVESDTGQLATQMLMSKELTESQKQELYNAMASNTVYNVGASVVVDKMVPGFLETKPGHFVKTRSQKIAAAMSLPGAKANISLAKLINGVGGGKKLSQATIDALNKEFVNFGVNDINSYMVKAAEANYAATKQIASAKVGESYTDAITGKTVKAASTTEAIDIAVNNKIRLQNMLDRVTRGFKAETEEILASPDIAKTRAESYAAASKVVEAEGVVGKKAAVQEVHGTKVVSFAQEDSNYLVYRRNLDYMDNKEAYAIAKGKELSAGDKEFQTALRAAVEAFETSNSPKLVEALETYYQANMAFNKAMTDWEVAHGIMSKETYESLKATGFFGLEDEFYIHTIAIKPTGAKFTDDYEAAYAEYMRNYNRHVGDSYRIDPTHVTDQHISRKFDPEQNYLDPELANAARISSMAQAYQAKNWGKALLGVGMPLKEIDTEGKLTSSAEIKSAMKSADAASVSAVERLTKEKLQPVLDNEGIVTLGAAAQEEYDLEGKLARSEAKEARKLGIANDEAVSKNVSKLSKEQVTENLESISGAPTYGKVKSYEEYQSMVESMPTKEMRAKAEKAVKTQEGAYDKTQKQRIKEFEAQKKAKLAEASKLESEASNIDKEIARIEKNNASGQAKYEKAKASAEKKKAKAEADAKKAAKAADDSNVYKSLFEDLNDASVSQLKFDVKDGAELDADDAAKAVAGDRADELELALRADINYDDFVKDVRKFLNDTDGVRPDSAKYKKARKDLIDKYIDPDYLKNAKAKAGVGEATEASVTGLKEKIIGEGQSANRVKEVPIAGGKYTIDYDASVADGINGLINEKGFSIKSAESGIIDDYPGVNRLLFSGGKGNIEFDDVGELKKSQINKIKKAAEKAGLEFDARYWTSRSGEKKLISLRVTQDVTTDGTPVSKIHEEALKNAIEKFGGKASDAKDMHRRLEFEKSLGNKLPEYDEFNRKEFSRLIEEHGRFFESPEVKKKLWDDFFKNMGVDVSNKQSVAIGERGSEAAATDPGKFDKVKAGISEAAETAEDRKIVDGHDYITSDIEKGFQQFVLDDVSPNTMFQPHTRSVIGDFWGPSTNIPNRANEALRSGKKNLDEVLDDFSEQIDVDDVVKNTYHLYDKIPRMTEEELAVEFEKDVKDLAKKLTGEENLDLVRSEDAIKEIIGEDIKKMARSGSHSFTNDTIVYRLVSTGGNDVNTGDLSWLSKAEGEFKDPGFMFVTLDEKAVLNHPSLTGNGEKYVLRVHAPKGTGLFLDDRYGLPVSSGGEMVLAPNQKGKFIKTGEKIGDAEYVDVYLKGWDRPEEIRPFVPTDTADKVAEAAAKREEAARIRGDVDSLKAPRSLSDKQKTVKAWNDAVKNESTLIPGLNRMWLQDAITSKSVDIPEEVMNNIKTQIANRALAEHTEIDLIDSLVMHSKNPIKTAESIDKWLDDLEGIRGDISRLKELLKAQKEGVTPFAEASRSILGEIVDGTKTAFEKNPVSARVLELAKEQGVDPELVKEYMAINALLRENGNGELVLRNDIQAATKKRIEKEMLSQIRAEDKVDTGMIKHIVKRFQDVIEETAKESWASIQKQLIDAGGNDFIDVGKNFNYVKKEMEKFVGQFHAANVIPMIGADGELKYYEVSPLIADLYQSRPLANYSKLSNFFNKTSRIARISSTNLNATSVVNQCFRDPLNAYIGAGMYKGFKAYESEMAELFGPELVAHLQEEMSAAGWDIFTDGGKVAGRDLEKKAASYIVETTGADTFAKESTQNALFEAQRTAARGARQGALDNLEYWNKQYKKSKLSLDDIIDKGARVVGAPGYKINESRELFLRKADYASAFNTALRQGKTVLEAKNIAEFVSRQATTNFGRMFMWGNSIVNAVPFLGAAINGSASFWRLVAIDPVGISTRFVTAGLAMMSLVAQSMTTKRDREIYKTVPEWMKQENVVFVYDGEVMKIPIPQELGAFLAPFRQAVEKSHPGVQSHEWLELLTNDLLEVSPIELDGFETLDEVNIDGDPTIWDRLSREGSALVSQFAPPFVKAAYMDATGVDPYTGNPIDTSYKWVDEDGNIQIIDNNQSSFAKWFSGKLEAAGIEKSTSVCYKLLNAAFGSGLLNVADGITNLFQGNPSNGVIATQLKEGLQAVRVEPYQLSDPYLREFKATIKELEAEKNAMLSADGELATLSQQLSMLKETDSNYDTKRKNLIREYNQKTEDYRQRVLNTVQNYNNHYGSTYTSQQFASVINLLTFDKSTLMPTNAYQSEQLSQLYYSAREQAYQTMIDMGFDSTTDNSIFGIARRNKYTGEVEIKYTSPTVILNMDNIAMGSGRVYAAELEQALKSAGLTKSARIQGYNDAKAKGSKALKQFKKEWNAEVAQAISETMNKYGSGNVINSGDAVQLLNEYFYISNTSYKVKDYLKDVFGEEE